MDCIDHHASCLRERRLLCAQSPVPPSLVTLWGILLFLSFKNSCQQQDTSPACEQSLMSTREVVWCVVSLDAADTTSSAVLRTSLGASVLPLSSSHPQTVPKSVLATTRGVRLSPPSSVARHATGMLRSCLLPLAWRRRTACRNGVIVRSCTAPYSLQAEPSTAVARADPVQHALACCTDDTKCMMTACPIHRPAEARSRAANTVYAGQRAALIDVSVGKTKDALKAVPGVQVDEASGHDKSQHGTTR